MPSINASDALNGATKKRVRRRTCHYCSEKFLPARSNQTFCSAGHRKAYWTELQSVAGSKLFREFLEWKKKRDEKGKKQARANHAGRVAGSRRRG